MPRSGEQTRQRILDAAYRQFRQKGYTRVSMDEIAAATTVTKRTLYYHFESKDQLLAAVLEAQHHLALAAFRTFGDKLSGSPKRLSTRCSGILRSGRTRRAGRAPVLRGSSSSWPTFPGIPRARSRAVTRPCSRRISRTCCASRCCPAARTGARDLAAVGRCDLADPGAPRPELLRRQRLRQSSC